MARKSLNLETNPLFNGPSLDDRNKTGNPFRYLPIRDIDVDPEQPRRVFEDDALNELAESIKQYGVLTPISVKAVVGGTYRIISGERRYRASKAAGIDMIPAIITYEEEEAEDILSKQLIENLQRENLTSMERAIAIGHMKEQFKLSVRDIAQKLSISKSMVQRSLDILGLPDDLQGALISGAPESKVLLLAKVDDRAFRKEILGRLDDFTRGQLEEIVKIGEIPDVFEQPEDTSVEEVSHGGTPSSEKLSDNPVVFERDQRIIEDIQRSLGARVQISRGKSKPERGKVVLEFYSEDDLNEVYNRLVLDDGAGS